MKRYALITGARDETEVSAYLPDNYRVIHTEHYEGVPYLAYVIEGTDVAGWTLDGYVIPRLASGNIQAAEISSPHPLVKPGNLQPAIPPSNWRNETP